MAKTKKDIDKDLMYKMLMPSGSRTAKTAQSAEAHSYALDDEQNARETMEEPLNQHKTIIRREVGVAFMDTQPTILVNTMENVVLEKLESALARFQCCKCDRCKKDIVAMALNKLPPKYMVLQDGQLTPDVDPQTNAQVVTAVIQAILAVRAHPRH
ncbi:late competence development ComFB family protein [Caproiciproducens faecalis]|uniref:Late competence development ComFB family protein n=1 Tax=Caproiciproducens faecalis TaxID=2820301 RepID=A0ABS7DN43_9FIRM|nr:late competence development ComFB family protein [Caproiciproducens faecalis]MBW7572210.1 late competence development ComFB family protein [Caproiciproducens faecalis]